jgi:predicted small lipoprotein YifL
MYQDCYQRCQRAALPLLLALTSALFTAGCGNKGPLYLPEPSDQNDRQSVSQAVGRR